MAKLDLTKPVQTRGGLPVRILATDLRSDCPVVGIVSYPDYDSVESWALSGKYIPDDNDEYEFDLVSVPVEVRRYFPVTRGAPTLQVLEFDRNSAEAIGYETLLECRGQGYLGRHGSVVEVVFVDGRATAANLIGGSDADTR